MILIAGTEGELLRGLAPPVPHQLLNQQVGQLDGPAAAGRLRLLEGEPAARLLQRLPHRRQALLQVYVLPAQGETKETKKARTGLNAHGAGADPGKLRRFLLPSPLGRASN